MILEQQRPEGIGSALRALRGPPLLTFLACLVTWTLSTMDQSLFGYAVPGILGTFGISLNAIGLMLSIGFALAVPGAMAAGLLTDRYGRRIALAVCLGLSGILVGLQAFATSAVMLGAVRSLALAVGTGLSPITNSYVAETAPSRIRGVMIGLLQCGYPIGWFVASIIVAPIMTHYGWRAIFMAAFLAVPVAGALYAALPESRHFETVKRSGAEQRNWRADLAELFAGKFRRQTLLCGAAFLTQGGAYAGSAFYLPTFFHQVRGYSEAVSAQIVGLGYAIGIIGYIGASLIGEFVLTRRNTIIVWCWMGAIAFLAFVWLPTGVNQDIVGYGCMAIFFYGAAAIMATYLLELFPTRLRASGAATGSAFLSLGFATYPLFVSHAIERLGWQPALSVSVAPSLLICGFAVLGLADIKSGGDVADL